MAQDVQDFHLVHLPPVSKFHIMHFHLDLSTFVVNKHNTFDIALC